MHEKLGVTANAAIVRKTKSKLTRLLISVALIFVAVGAYSEPVEHTYSTDAIISIDPLLTGLTSVSGSFMYDNGGAPGGTIPDGSSTAGSTFYGNISALLGPLRVACTGGSFPAMEGFQ